MSAVTIDKDGAVPWPETFELRDQFAMAALPLYANCDSWSTQQIARSAYELADAMLEERNKNPPDDQSGRGANKKPLIRQAGSAANLCRLYCTGQKAKRRTS